MREIHMCTPTRIYINVYPFVVEHVYAFALEKNILICSVFLQEYKAEFEKTLKWIDNERQKLMQAEQRWVDSWNTSVEKVKQLY